ncbi:MAG: TetR/AcrR family transcriptional regulator [Rhizobiaceae bacterium]
MPIQPRAQRTRAALLDAVERIVAVHGPEAVTTTRIAQETNVAVGTIYRYFTDRDEMLLGAYDATVTRIVATCAASQETPERSGSPFDAAEYLLSLYLETAEKTPGHAGLLKAMRAIRPIEADQSGNNEVTIVGALLLPFWQRYAHVPPDPARLHFLSVLLGTLVDLYLMTPDQLDRERLRGEISAHMRLALERALEG